jgi:hypothetical protein
MQTDIKKIKEPLELLHEIEIFICSKLGAEPSIINEDEMKAIKESIIFCIEDNKKIIEIDSVFLVKK